MRIKNPSTMATQHPQRDNSKEPNSRQEDQLENRGNSSARPSSLANSDEESISTAGDTALGKGSKTSVRKDEKESNDNYDQGRS